MDKTGVVFAKCRAINRAVATVADNTGAKIFQSLATDPAKVDPMIDTDDHKVYAFCRITSRRSARWPRT